MAWLSKTVRSIRFDEDSHHEAFSFILQISYAVYQGVKTEKGQENWKIGWSQKWNVSKIIFDSQAMEYRFYYYG